MTILYNISTNQIISPTYLDGYKVDEMTLALPPDIVELSVIRNYPPYINSRT